MNKNLSTKPYALLFQLTEGSDIKQGGCWIWLGRKRPNLQRWSYETYKGPIPTGKKIIPTCLDPTCWNPEHLQIGKPAAQLQSHCKRGHPFSGANLYVRKITGKPGIRICRTCMRMARARYAKKKGREILYER